MSAVCRDIRGLRAAGATIREIAALTGLSPSAVYRRLAPKARAATVPAPTVEPHRRKGRTERACLCCGKPFLSEGAHNRLCDVCRKGGGGPFDTPATVRYR